MPTYIQTTGGFRLVMTSGNALITTAQDASAVLDGRAGRLKLIINGPSSSIFTASNWRVALHAEHSLVDLRWKFDFAEGGSGDGEARVKMDRSSYLYDLLVRRGQSGVAQIVWVRDEAIAANFDAETDMFWIGTVEDAQVDRHSNIVKFKLRGAGEVLRDLTFTGSFNGEKLTDIAYEVLAAAITAGSLVSTRDVDTAGVLQRRISKTYDRTPIAKILAELQEAAGGPEFVSWGVRPPDDWITQTGIAYFKLFGAHLYEKDNTIADPPRSFSISARMANRKSLEFITSEVKNVVTVIGDRLEGRPDDEPAYIAGSAQSADSIGRYGARHLVVQDSSLKNSGQCAAVAAGKVIELASRRVEVKVEGQAPLSNVKSIDEKAFNLVNGVLLKPGKVCTVRDEGERFIAWGDSQRVYKALAAGNWLRIDTSAQPATDPPLLNLKASLGSGVRRVYFLTQRRPSMAAPTLGVSVMELDRAVMAHWIASGADWKLETRYRDAGGTWTVLGASAGVVTSAALANPHLVVVEVAYEDASNHRVKSWFYQSGTATLMTNQTLAHASVNASATDDSWYVNAAATTALDTPTNTGDSQHVETMHAFVMKEWPAGVSEVTQIQNIALAGPPWKRYRSLCLMSDFGIWDEVNYKALVRYSHNQVVKRASWDALMRGATPGTDSLVAAATAFTARTYTWLLGSGEHGRPLGTHVEIYPAEVEFRYGGPHADLGFTIEGISGARTGSKALRELAIQVAEAQENTRRAS